MLNLFSRAIEHIGNLFSKQSMRKLFPVFLAGVLLLTSNVDGVLSEKKLEKAVDNAIHQDKEKRPKTTGDWNQQSRETQGKPGDRLKRVGEQSAEAFKDFGSVFPDTAKRSAAELKNNGKISK
jgi:hypothetical protein